MKGAVKLTLITIFWVAFVVGAFAQPPEVSTDTLRMPEGIIAHPGDTICVPVHLINTLAVVGFKVNIPHDTLLEVVDILPGEALDSFWVNPNFGFDPFSIDSVVFVLGNTQGDPYSTYFPPGDHIVANIYFSIPTTITDSMIFPLHFVDDTIHDPPRYNIIADTTDFVDKMPIKDNGSLIVVTDVVETEHPQKTKAPLAIWQEGNKTVFQIEVGNRASVTLDVFGIDGRLIEKLFEGEVGPGAFVLRRELELPRGVYFLKVDVGTKSYTERFMKW